MVMTGDEGSFCSYIRYKQLGIFQALFKYYLTEHIQASGIEYNDFHACSEMIQST